MEADAYVKSTTMTEENNQKAYSLVLRQWTELLKIKLKKSAGRSKKSTNYNVLEIVKLIKYIIFNSKDQKYLPISIHKSKMKFYTLYQGNMTNVDYLEKLNNLVDVESSFKGQLHDQDIVGILTKEKYPGGLNGILDPYKK